VVLVVLEGGAGGLQALVGADLVGVDAPAVLDKGDGHGLQEVTTMVHSCQVLLGSGLSYTLWSAAVNAAGRWLVANDSRHPACNSCSDAPLRDALVPQCFMWAIAPWWNTTCASGLQGWDTMALCHGAKQAFLDLTDPTVSADTLNFPVCWQRAGAMACLHGIMVQLLPFRCCPREAVVTRRARVVVVMVSTTKMGWVGHCGRQGCQPQDKAKDLGRLHPGAVEKGCLREGGFSGCSAAANRQQAE